MKTQISKPNSNTSRNGSTGRALFRAPCFRLSIFYFPLVFGVALLILSSSNTKAGSTNDITSLVQRGLFEEEANHNLDAAMQSYEAAIKLHDKDRKLAATAIFRLGECYRKQNKTEEANAQFKRIVTEFPDQKELADLSRGYLPKGTSQFQTQLTKIMTGGSESDLDKQYRELSVETAKAEALWKHAKDLDGHGRIKFFTAIQPDQLLIDLVNRRFEANAKLDRLSAEYGTQNPQYKAQQESAATIAAQLDERADTLVWSIEQKYKMLKEQEDALKSRLNQTSSTAAKVKELLTTSDEDEEIRKIKEMIQNSPDLINVAVSSDEGTPLQQACTIGHLKVAEFLLANGADVNVRTEKVSPPLICAAVHGHKALVDLLLSKGADIETKSTDTYNKQTALMCAAFRGFKTLTQTLLAHGADINATDSTGRTSLHRAVENGYFEIAELLLTNKASVDATTLEKKTPLHLASDSDNVELVKVLVEHGADVNAKSDGGFTPLLNAAEHGNLTVANFLLEHGANTEDAVSGNWNQHDFRGFRPINFAIFRHDATLLKVLLEHHANPNSRFTRQSSQDAWPGAFPLLTAYNNAELLEILLEHGADPNLADDTGNTALHCAVRSQQKSCVEILIAHGANVNASDERGAPPISYVRGAAKGNVGEVRQMLLKAGASENYIRLKQICASRNGQERVVFTRGTNNWNHYTLFELLGSIYQPGNVPAESALRTLPTRVARGAFVLGQPGSAATVDFRFPDLYPVKIHRLLADGKLQEIQVNAGGQLSTANPQDTPLEWGDIVEIPEQDHAISATWEGLAPDVAANLIRALHRQVEIVISRPAEAKQLISLGDNGGNFRLSDAIAKANVLRSSSDPSQIKVTHRDSNQSIIFDLSKSGSPEEPWLKAGDTIEIPDHAAAAASQPRSSPE